MAQPLPALVPENLYIGLSGYSFKPWQGEGRFYPPELKQKEYLAYYATRYRGVEMDGSWYKTPTEAAVAQWLEGTPDDFRFNFKLHRRITHMGRLKEETYESIPYLLKRMNPLAKAGKLGPFLVQLPPNMKRNDERLDNFLKSLPKTYGDVEGLTGREAPEWSFEFRHESWTCPETEEILRSHGAGWVASDRDEAKADRRDTAPFHYTRLRRTDTDDASLTEWATYFRGLLADGRKVYVYCKHEDDGSPWDWADALLKKTGSPTGS